MPDAATAGVEQAHSPQQYLYTFLRSPGRAADTVPDWFIRRLESALQRYGIHGLAWPSTAAGTRARQAVPGDAAGGLARARGDPDPRPPGGAAPWLPGEETARARERTRLNDLVVAAQSRYPAVSDLAHEIRFRWFDSPLLEDVLAGWRAEAEQALSQLRDDPEPRRSRAR